MRTCRAIAAGCSMAVALVLTTALSASAGSPSSSLTESTVSRTVDEPCNVLSAPDGALWMVTQVGRTVTRFDPKTGARQTVALPPDPTPAAQRYQDNVNQIQATGVPQSMGPCDMTIGGDGNLWVNDPLTNSVGYIGLRSAPYVLHEIPLPTPNALPVSLAAGADGNIYATEEVANAVAEINVRTHQVTEYPVPTAASGIVGGYPGQDGKHWFVELAAGKLMSYDYATHAMREYTIPGTGVEPFVVRVYGDTVWFTEFGTGSVGRYCPSTGTWSQVTLPTKASGPIGLARGLDGMLYTDESATAKVARIDPRTMTTVAEYSLAAAGSYPDETKMGPDGAIWVPELLTGKLARLWLSAWGPDPGYPRLG